MTRLLHPQPKLSSSPATAQPGKWRSIVTYGLTCGLAILSTPQIPAIAQSISIDGSTPTTQLNGLDSCSGNCDITGGLRDGNGSESNLFHNFSTFNIENGFTVNFVDPGVDNIFSQVTGTGVSNIDGTLKVSGSANLFLLNQNGIIFGENAQLDIPGSFLSTTASDILFQNGSNLSEIASDNNSLLTINVPVGLQFGTAPSPITVQGNGNSHLAYNNNFIDRSTPTEGLIANNSQTLAFIGGDISLSGGNIAAESGHIEIGSLGPNSLVKLDQAVSDWNFDYSGAISFGNITLSQQATLDISGRNAGSVQLNGQNITLSEGSAIIGKVIDNGGGQIYLNASDSLTLEGENVDPSPGTDNPLPTSALLEIAPGATGDGSSQITVNAPNINITDAAQIGLGMGGSGTSGKVDVVAQNINVDGAAFDTPSGIYAAVLPSIFIAGASADGQGGDLTIKTEQLSVTNGANITASTFDIGNAGNLTIKAKDIEVSGRNPFRDAAVSSIRSASEIPPIPFIPPIAGGSGSSGILTLNTERLTVSDLGQVGVATNSNSPAGNLIINASDFVVLTDGNALQRSGLFASAVSEFGLPPSNGLGGDIQINTNQLSVLNGATINASNFPSGAAATGAVGQGAAGNIDIAATAVAIKDGGLITADTVAGNRANINITSDSLVLRRGSNITTNATGTATGGNINIDSEALVAFENSDITANATDNFGGRIIVNAPTIIGTGYREQQTVESDITATSDLGPAFSGSVEINSPKIDPTDGLTELPEGLSAEEQIVAACEKIDSNVFVATGRGGLPEDASQLITAQSVWNDFRLIEEASSSLASETTGNAGESAQKELSPPLMEAQTWSIDQNGQVILGTASTASVATQQATGCLS